MGHSKRSAKRFDRDSNRERVRVVDANGFVGHWPYRELDASVETLLGHVDDADVDRVFVSSIESVTHRNHQSVNCRLTATVDGHEYRLVPFTAFNTTYPT